MRHHDDDDDDFSVIPMTDELHADDVEPEANWLFYVKTVLIAPVRVDDEWDEPMVTQAVSEMSTEEKAQLVDAALAREGHDEAEVFDVELLATEEDVR